MCTNQEIAAKVKGDTVAHDVYDAVHGTYKSKRPEKRTPVEVKTTFAKGGK